MAKVSIQPLRVSDVRRRRKGLLLRLLFNCLKRPDAMFGDIKAHRRIKSRFPSFFAILGLRVGGGL